ncbi:MAG TPA: 23S rRNA (adenine(2030)-N(6))-methyltransferase RlmJ [Alphaproteobacteria bacterium]|nr:23S rRNA (adenine(2030)-N(6))-methyltransferase RlmJ [Alphaproteobacteria bacterium]
MLSYQHIYHAANFADVQKHALLAQVLKSLAVKPAPLCAFDTHAGRGLYALEDTEAQKNREFDNGITALWPQRAEAPPALRPYLDAVSAFNPDGTLSFYPGSAMLCRQMLRATDRLIATERHPGEFGHLQQAMAKGAAGAKPRIQTLLGDGLKTLVDNLPAAERRALAVIDPSYEMKTDYTDVPKAILRALKKMPQLCVFLWYPMLGAGGHRLMLTELVKSGVRDALVSEIRLDAPPQEHFRMTGSGILIINPPWPEAVMNDVTQAVTSRLPAKAFGDVFWLDNCRINPDTGLIVI